jgi:hypothetical protein
MSAVFETARTDQIAMSHAVARTRRFDYPWSEVVTEPDNATMWLNASPYAPLGGAVGSGFAYSPTEFPILHFIGECEDDAQDGGEFGFAGLGYVSGCDSYQNVYLKGTATRTFKIAHTPFLEGFHGHAVVSRDEYTWAVNTTSLYKVTGVVAAKPPARRARHQEPSRAYNAFKELGSWLEMSDEELAPIVKVARGTVATSWKNGNEPHKREQGRRLFQLHALVSALHAILGDDLGLWLKRGSPCPLTLLEKGEIDRFERAADTLIFPPSPSPRPRLDAAWTPDDPGSARVATEPGGELKRANRVRSRRLER